MGTTLARSTNMANSSNETADQQLRANKVIDASVYNDQDHKIGSVNELLIGSADDISSALLSIGGFLGIGSKLVNVSYSQL